MKISYFRMIIIWFTLSIVMAYILFATAVLPGVNIPGIPVIIVMTLFVHLSMFFWIMWTYIDSPDPSKPQAQTYEKIQEEAQQPWLIYGYKKNQF